MTKKTIHVAAASINQTPLDWTGNILRATSAVRAARQRGVEVLCLPELAISGYGCEDMFLADWVMERAEEALLSLASQCGNIVVVCGYPLIYEGSRYNAAAIIADNKIKGIVPKRFLANDGIHYETRWFRPWSGEKTYIEIKGEKIPFGPYIFNYKDILMGVEVCEDAWVKNRPAIEYLKEGVSLILNPSASHFEFSKLAIRQRTATILSKINEEIVYVYSNLLGNEAGRAIYDGSSFISKGDSVIARAPRFSFKDYTLLSQEVELGCVVDSSCRKDSSSITLSSMPKEPSQPTGDLNNAFEASKSIKEEEFTRAVSLGMFDYLRKSGSKGYVVSLSGGADSAACSVLAYLSIVLAIGELGEEATKRKLGYESADSIDISSLLFLAYLKTENNSEETLNSARSVAKGLQVPLHEFEVDDLIESYTSKVSGCLDKSLSWERHSISLQNIQARTRGPLVWFIANLRGALLLATSNRSEAAVGYTTMDGDTCGGLSPIGGIDKEFLLSYLSWLASQGNHTLGDLSFLTSVNNLSPSAELKPLTQHQTDEEDLMPYAVLAIIERGFVKEKLSRAALITKLLKEKTEVAEPLATEWVDKFLNLWSRNQWKRERYAPAFHLDEQSLDPKTWCRFPILSGSMVSDY